MRDGGEYGYGVAADELETKAETEARGSRDFGRGYKHAIRVLRGEV